MLKKVKYFIDGCAIPLLIIWCVIATVLISVKLDEVNTDLQILYLAHDYTASQVDAIQDKLKPYMPWIDWHEFYHHEYTKDKDRRYSLEIPDRFVKAVRRTWFDILIFLFGRL